jgi:hypothetical protein
MKPTDGLKRGTPVRNTGHGIRVPVGEKVLGHVWNVWGEALDEDPEDFDQMERWEIHRPAPNFDTLEPSARLFPTGMVRPPPVFFTAVPRTRPSVGFRQMARTRDSPICCATSAFTGFGLPSMVMSKASMVLICGTASGGNSTSITGPAMATTRPSFNVGWLSVTVMSVLRIRRGGRGCGGRRCRPR